MTRRQKFRQGLSKLYLPYYDGLCEVLPEHWQPYQGLRSVGEQDNLYAQGRSRPGKVVTWAPGGSSPHNYGCATDWTVWEGGKPLWPSVKDPIWREYQQACEKVGVRWGADWNMNGDTSDERKHDAPHNELIIDCSWKHVYLVFSKNGMTAAQQYIEERIHRSGLV